MKKLFILPFLIMSFIVLPSVSFGSFADLDGDGILDDGDNSSIAGDNPCTGGEIVNCDDNCANTPNGPDNGTCTTGDYTGNRCTDNTTCGSGGFCSMNQEDSDADGAGDACDNCPSTPNGPSLGTCEEPFMHVGINPWGSCTDSSECNPGEVCEKSNRDANADDVGDVCGCYADFNGDGRINFSDLLILTGEYGRTDCSQGNPCQADANGDGKVSLRDMSLVEEEFQEWCQPPIP